MFCLRSNHKPRYILNEQEWSLMAVASLNEVSHLLRRLRINNPPRSRRLASRDAHHAAMVGNDPNLYATNTSMAGDHFLRVVRLKLVEMSLVKQTFQQLSDVVGLAMVLGNDVVQLFSWTRRLPRCLN